MGSQSTPAASTSQGAPWSGHVPSPGRRTPVTTYRLQLGRSLTFDDARDLLPYLSDLGVTDLYLSPVLQAAPGSTHGYDVVDHGKVSEVMGGREGLQRLADEAHDLGLGIVVDIVPNHVAIPTPAWHNKELWSFLREGQDSPFARWFDASRTEPMLLPVLGKRLGQVLADGELRLDKMVVPTEPERGEQPVLRYFDTVLPVAAGTQELEVTELVQRQHYRLAYWKVGDEELSYRRFFDVGTLAAIRVEDPEVFSASHRLVVELIEAGTVDALRVDHPDGLADPAGYLTRLSEVTGGAWVAAEKILAPEEPLPASWPVAGTTGYDASWRVDQLLTDPSGSQVLGELMRELTGESPADYPRVVETAKREVVNGSLAAEVNRLASLLHRVTSTDVVLADHTLRDLRACVVELLVAAQRYRAYVVPGQVLDPEQAAVLRSDAERARERLTPDQHETLDLVVSLLLGEPVGSVSRRSDPARAEVVVRFQQVCGAVTAKGVEDTAFYRWTHLTSLSEVGGDPQGLALSPERAHSWARSVQNAWPCTMVTSTTHDTKRGEDVRARIGVISSYAQQWRDLVRRLRSATAGYRPHDLDGRSENLLWQSLWGTWASGSADPMTPERLCAYLVKASREQKVWTRWTRVNQAQESALTSYATALLADPVVTQEMSAFDALTYRETRSAVLASKAVTMTWLGVADLYQGSETTRTSLVDPDNRRPVTYDGPGGLRETLRRLDDGEAPRTLDDEKLLLTTRLAHLRARRPETFVGPRSGYQALPVSTGHVFAYARTLDSEPDVLVLIRRLGRSLEEEGGWGSESVVLPRGRWSSVLSPTEVDGGQHALSDLLGEDPVVVLERVSRDENRA